MIKVYEIKEKGKQYFKAQNYEMAILNYSQAVELFEQMMEQNKIQDEQTMIQLIQEIEISCTINIAVCQMKINQYQNAIDNLNKIVSQYEDNKKALYLRGKCFMFQGKYDESKKDLNQCLLLDKGDQETLMAISQLNQLIEKYKKKSAKMCQNMIQKTLKQPTSFIDQVINLMTKDQRLDSRIIYPFSIVFYPMIQVLCKKRVPSQFYQYN